MFVRHSVGPLIQSIARAKHYYILPSGEEIGVPVGSIRAFMIFGVSM